ncbi:MAG: hypothetical protein IKE24_04485, partial [Clostridia bacterium]|nr:hypothetical protein [Clostridia bacterium]
MENFPETSQGPVKSEVNLTKGLVLQDMKPTISLFRSLIENNYGNHLRFNVMTGRQEFFDRREQVWREWTDANDAQLRLWFQSNFGLYHEKMLRDALHIHFDFHRVNPLTDLLDSLVWDGKSRINNFLHDILGCDDTAYYREVSRLIFAGGIHRAYRPGCKFDDMIVLVGEQGGGKSTIVRWLNMDDSFFREIKVITGKESCEALRGVWIAEVAELMAMTRVKESEAVKAYITAQEDSYRPPYARYVQTVPRRCTFIGTTNNPLFLSDRTGNRRFYPVACKANGYDILEKESEIREYISQCWAEALYLFRKDELPPYADKSVISAIRQKQEAAMEDDWRVGAISQYLESVKRSPKDTVSIIELWHCALNVAEEIKPCRKDSIEISQIVLSLGGWKRAESTTMTRWGKQRY